MKNNWCGYNFENLKILTLLPMEPPVAVCKESSVR